MPETLQSTETPDWLTLLQRLREGPSGSSLARAQRAGIASSDMELLTKAIHGCDGNELDVIIAFDTNCLKKFRRESLLLQKVIDLSRENINFVIPGQSYVEYYNNHTAFSKEMYSKYSNDLSKVSKTLESDAWIEVAQLGFVKMSELQDFRESLNEFIADYKPDQSKANIEATLGVIDEFIKAGATVPFVPREEFYELGRVRLESKLPPGWADMKGKGSQALGDFYCWVDLLLAMIGRKKFQRDSKVKLAVFVSDDVSKSDWNVASFAHPFLAAECASVTGYSFRKITVGDLSNLVESFNV